MSIWDSALKPLKYLLFANGLLMQGHRLKINRHSVTIIMNAKGFYTITSAAKPVLLIT